jgi:hypothetical protein
MLQSSVIPRLTPCPQAPQTLTRDASNTHELLPARGRLQERGRAVVGARARTLLARRRGSAAQESRRICDQQSPTLGSRQLAAVLLATATAHLGATNRYSRGQQSGAGRDPRRQRSCPATTHVGRLLPAATHVASDPAQPRPTWAGSCPPRPTSAAILPGHGPRGQAPARRDPRRQRSCPATAHVASDPARPRPTWAGSCPPRPTSPAILPGHGPRRQRSCPATTHVASDPARPRPTWAGSCPATTHVASDPAQPRPTGRLSCPATRPTWAVAPSHAGRARARWQAVRRRRGLESAWGFRLSSGRRRGGRR